MDILFHVETKTGIRSIFTAYKLSILKPFHLHIQCIINEHTVPLIAKITQKITAFIHKL